jgi:hypothetical protein
MNFYEFTQNNSGGDFITNDNLCHRLVIEATDASVATEKALSLGVYFDGIEKGVDCSCCGDRWYSIDEYNALKFPYRYGSFKKDVVSELCQKYEITYSLSETNGYDLIFDDISSYCQYMADEYGWTNPDCRIYYNDGRIIPIFSKNKKLVD